MPCPRHCTTLCINQHSRQRQNLLTQFSENLAQVYRCRMSMIPNVYSLPSLRYTCCTPEVAPAALCCWLSAHRCDQARVWRSTFGDAQQHRIVHYPNRQEEVAVPLHLGHQLQPVRSI